MLMNYPAKEEFLNLPPFEGRIWPSYNQPLFLKAISDCHRLLGLPEARIVLEGRNKVGVVPLCLTGGIQKNVFIKEFRLVGVNKIKSLFLPSKALKAWRGAVALVEQGISTPFPIAYLERRRRGVIEQSFFLAEEVESAEEVRRLFRELPEPELRDFLRVLAVFLSTCHRKGILHRDLSDGNILAKRDRTGNWEFILIDTNRIRVKRKIGTWQGVRNLIRLGVPSNLQAFFLAEYLRDGGLGRFPFFLYRTNKKAYTWYINLKKTLRLKKLARKLRLQ